MQDKEKVIVEIMGLVSAYGSAVEATVFSEGHSREEHKEFRAYKLVESKLRELMKQTTVQKPLSEEQMETLIEKHAPPIHPDFSEDDDFDELVRAVERAHGIIKGF